MIENLEQAVAGELSDPELSAVQVERGEIEVSAALHCATCAPAGKNAIMSRKNLCIRSRGGDRRS